MRRTVARAPFVLAVALSLACDAATAPATPARIDGPWTLQRVNGAALPHVIQAASPRVEVLSDRLLLASTGAFTETYVIRFTDGTMITTETGTDSGTFVATSAAVTLTYSDGAVSPAVLGGPTMALSGGGVTRVYAKQ